MLYTCSRAANSLAPTIALTPRILRPIAVSRAHPRSNPAVHPRSDPIAPPGAARLTWPTWSASLKRLKTPDLRGSSDNRTSNSRRCCGVRAGLDLSTIGQTPCGVERGLCGVRQRSARGSSVDFPSGVNTVFNTSLIGVHELPTAKPRTPTLQPRASTLQPRIHGEADRLQSATIRGSR